MIIKKKDLRGLAKSFSYAFRGIAYCINNERNMRIHLTATVFVSLFAVLYGLSDIKFIALIFCFAIVIMAEAVNTAIEALVNLASPSYSNYARIAKDVAAGAVLVVAVGSVFIGGFLFLSDISHFVSTVIMICTSYIWLPVFIILLAVSILFIFNGPKLYGEKTTRIYKMKNYNFYDAFDEEKRSK